MATARAQVAARIDAEAPAGVVVRWVDRVALIDIDAVPPCDLARGHADRMATWLAELACDAVVLTGASMFASEARAVAPKALAANPRPVIAMIMGNAEGQGLELALACHGRVATEDARFAFPASAIGLLPVDGGLARLARLVGPATAGELVVFGRAIGARAALERGLVDAVAPGPAELELAAVALARRLAGAPRRTAEGEAREPSAGWGRELAELREQVRRRRPGQEAPAVAVRALEQALRWPLPRAMAEIRVLAEDLARSEQAAALRHAAECEGAVLVTPASATPATAAEVLARLRSEGDQVAFRVFAPARRVRLVEILPAADTPAEVLARLAELMRRLGKPALLRRPGARPGLINRLRWPMLREAIHMLDEGATPAQIDRALLAFGFAFAPFAALDQEGLEALEAECLDLPDAWDRYSPTIDMMFDAGRLGASARRGWYSYREGHSAPLLDPGMDRLLLESAQAQRIGRRALDDDEIVRRCLACVVAAAAQLLQSGEAGSEAEIDAVWTGVLGFPRWRGGPMYHARHAPGKPAASVSPGSSRPPPPPPRAGPVRPDARPPPA